MNEYSTIMSMILAGIYFKINIYITNNVRKSNE
jgi:hypothetical protein